VLLIRLVNQSAGHLSLLVQDSAMVWFAQRLKWPPGNHFPESSQEMVQMACQRPYQPMPDQRALSRP
jgi:hypothetical protein